MKNYIQFVKRCFRSDKEREKEMEEYKKELLAPMTKESKKIAEFGGSLFMIGYYKGGTHQIQKEGRWWFILIGIEFLCCIALLILILT